MPILLLELYQINFPNKYHHLSSDENNLKRRLRSFSRENYISSAGSQTMTTSSDLTTELMQQQQNEPGCRLTTFISTLSRWFHTTREGSSFIIMYPRFKLTDDKIRMNDSLNLQKYNINRRKSSTSFDKAWAEETKLNQYVAVAHKFLFTE